MSTENAPKPSTEKELADWLQGAHHRVLRLPAEDRWRELAVSVTELLGVTLAPEKPEPGTWHFTDGYMSPAPEVPAYVSEVGNLHLVHLNGRIEGFSAGSDAWPALTPARVVSEAELAVLTDEDRAFDDVLSERDRLHEIADRLASLLAPPAVLGEHSSGNDPWQNAIEYAETAALANHGGARELPGRGEVYQVLKDAWLIKTTALSYFSNQADAVMDLLGGGDRD